jgi:glycosyltransferase involved in cell wall biosynthesis
VTSPSISVIVIVYDGASFLDEAIMSVRGQTCQDYELLIVDDGSTDDSLAIAERHRLAHPHRIRVLRHPGGVNRGMSASRNLGIAHAQGDFVAFLDADDVWLPRKLEEQVAILRAEPSCGLVYGRALIWRSWRTARAEDDFYYDLGVEPGRMYAAPQLFLRQLRNVDQTPTTSGAMLRRSLITQVGGFEDVFRGMFEDQVFFAKALLAAPAYVSDATWFRYRQHPASATARSAAAGADHLWRMRYLRWLAERLAEFPGADLQRAAVRAEMRQARRSHARRRALQIVRRLRRPWRASR